MYFIHCSCKYCTTVSLLGVGIGVGIGVSIGVSARAGTGVFHLLFLQIFEEINCISVRYISVGIGVGASVGAFHLLFL